MLKWAFEGKLTHQHHGLNGLKDDTDRAVAETEVLREIHQSVTISDSDKDAPLMAAEPEMPYLPGKNQSPHTHQINHSADKGELPEGWKWVPLKDMIAKIRCGTGVVPTNEKSIHPILRSSSVRNGKIDFSDVKFIQDHQKLKGEDFISKNDLLFTRLNGSVEYVGNCAKVPDIFPENLIYPDRLFRMRLINSDYADYIMHFFASSLARRIIEENAKSTAGHMRISTPDITEMLVPICPVEMQHLIVQAIESRFSVADKIEESITQSLQQTEALRQSILKKAFEGKLV